MCICMCARVCERGNDFVCAKRQRRSLVSAYQHQRSWLTALPLLLIVVISFFLLLFFSFCICYCGDALTFMPYSWGKSFSQRCGAQSCIKKKKNNVHAFRNTYTHMYICVWQQQQQLAAKWKQQQKKQLTTQNSNRISLLYLFLKCPPSDTNMPPHRKLHS